YRQGTLKDAGTVRFGEDRFLERVADLAPVDVERGDKLDIATTIATDGGAHHALERSALAAAIIFDALNQGTGAVADAGNGYFNILSHRHDTPTLQADPSSPNRIRNPGPGPLRAQGGC